MTFFFSKISYWLLLTWELFLIIYVCVHSWLTFFPTGKLHRRCTFMWKCRFFHNTAQITTFTPNSASWSGEHGGFWCKANQTEPKTDHLKQRLHYFHKWTILRVIWRLIGITAARWLALSPGFKSTIWLGPFCVGLRILPVFVWAFSRHSGFLPKTCS